MLRFSQVDQDLEGPKQSHLPIYTPVSSPSIIHAATSIESSYRQFNSIISSINPITGDLTKWIPPAPNWVKLNFDGSVYHSSSAAGFVLRDEFGSPLIVGARKIHGSNVSIAECTSFKDGLHPSFYKER
uniref:uncharacterized protein LOC105349693 n=1 Tax=Fragaria vesca subsp. vesca TaxID=101020 RepID=UPI0005C9DD94|nr:PREDICTED: uncharacterized protein LOC105349693 [Fragaria vesca subsp. vesca]